MANFPDPRPGSTRILKLGVSPVGFLSGAATLLFILCAAYLTWAADRGFDLSDDAYYFVAVRDVFSYRFSLTEFGQVWYPVYLLAGGDLGIYRLFGIGFLAVSASVFAYFLLGPETTVQVGRPVYMASFLALVANVFWIFGHWLPTPNYNTVNLAGLLLFFSGLLAADGEFRNVGRASLWIPSILSGIGLCGMALVKPTTACFAVIVGCLWLAISKPRLAWARLLVAALAAALLFLVTILIIDDSFSNFLARKVFSIEALALRKKGYDLGSLVAAAVAPFQAGRMWKVFDALSLGLLLFALTGAWAFFTHSAILKKHRLILGAVFALVFSAFVAYWRALDFVGPLIPAYHVWRFAALIVGSGCCLLVAASRSDALSLRHMAIVALLMIGPLVYAFGTADTLVLALSGAGIFWVAGGMYAAKVLPAQVRQTVLAGMSFFAVASILGILLGMGFSPWPSAAPIWEQRNRLVLGDTYVRVDDLTNAYLRAFQITAAANGFTPNGGIMDLSGSGPGLGLAIGGKAIGAPWLSPSGPGGMTFNQYMLSMVPSGELHRAWVVTRGAGDHLAEAKVLNAIGLNFPQGYERLVSLTRRDVGWDHTLWRPRESFSHPRRSPSTAAKGSKP